MISTNPFEASPVWDSNDVSAFREFLNSATGRKIFPLLVEEGPTLGGEEPHSVALRAKLVEGYLACVRALSRLTAGIENTNVEEPTAYPPLDDDRYWKGAKLTSDDEKE
jgi:hypothetical protein